MLYKMFNILQHCLYKLVSEFYSNETFDETTFYIIIFYPIKKSVFLGCCKKKNDTEKEKYK